MKLCKLILLSLLLTTNAWAWLGNTNDGTITDGIGTSINAGRFLATSNMTVDVVKAKVLGVGGKYKCAIYNGSATLPSTFVRGTTEITISTNGWYSFPLTSDVSITNGQNYWLAIWSDTSGSGVYYTSGGTLRWVTSSPYSANWITPLNTDSGSTANYCIYAQDKVTVVPPNTNPPPVITTNKPAITLAWDASPDASVTGYRIFYGVESRVYTNSFVVGNVLLTTINDLSFSTQYYFTAKAYNAAGVESVYCNEISYITISVTNNTLSAPVILYLNQIK